MSSVRPSLPSDSEPALHAGPLPATPESRTRHRTALGVALVLSVLAVSWIASPLWVGLMLGTVLAFTAQPAYGWILARRRHGRSAPRDAYLAASLVTLLSAFLATVLGAISLYFLARELLLIGTLLQQRMANGTPLDALGPRAIRLLDRLHVNRAQVSAGLNDLLGRARGEAVAAAGALLQAMTGSVLGLWIALITEFYVLLESPQLAARVEAILPLDPQHTRALMIEFKEVSRSTLVGTALTAALQGALAAIGYAIAGVDTPITWGLLTAMASLLPVVGTLLVWVPIGAYEIWNERVAWGVFVLVWGFVAVTVAVDYYVRPRLVRTKGRGNPLLMLVSLIGGIEVLGVAGLIAGPILMSLFLAVVRIYEREVAGADATSMAPGTGH